MVDTSEIIITRTFAQLKELRIMISRKLVKSASLVETTEGWSVEFKTEYGDRVFSSSKNAYYPKTFKGFAAPIKMLRKMGFDEVKLVFLKAK